MAILAFIAMSQDVLEEGRSKQRLYVSSAPSLSPQTHPPTSRFQSTAANSSTTTVTTMLFSTPRGVYASIAAFLLFSMIQFRDGPFIRPHPAFWRVVLGINLLYELALVFLLFQDLDTARGYMKLLDPSLGVPLPETDYSKHCKVTLLNVWVCTRLDVCDSPVLNNRCRTQSTSSVWRILWGGSGKL